MTVDLCNNLSETNIINKNIIVVSDNVSCTVKGNISIETPILILAYDSDVTGINYVVIPDFGRSYFITDIINLTGGRYEIRCKVDVLESFKSQILALPVIIDKQQNVSLANTYLDDGSFITENKEFNTVINFPSGFNDAGEYILITAGGGGGII